MDVFYLSTQQMLMIFTFIAIGFFLRRKNLLPENAGSVLSKLEIYVFTPALTFGNLIANCTVSNFLKNYDIIFYGLVIVLIAVLISHPLSKVIVRKSKGNPEREYLRNIYKYALTFGNYGLMGNFIVLGIWGDEMFYKYTMFCFFLGVVAYSWGVYVLIPKEANKGILHNLKTGLLTPPLISVVMGMVCGILNIGRYIPQFLMTTLDNAGACMGPVGMILAGIVIGGFEFKSLLKNVKVYWATLFRLIVIPAVFVTVLKLLGVDSDIVTMAFIAFATPLGMNTVVYPAAYDGDVQTGASMTMISHILSVITIPVMYLIFIVLW